MFTGLIEACGTVKESRPSETGESLVLVCEVGSDFIEDVKGGDSIAVNGCCLTVTSVAPSSVAFDVSSESLAVTNLSVCKPGSLVNLEKAIAVGQRLGGHLVSGHVDGTSKLLTFDKSKDGSVLRVEIGRELSQYTVRKGSAAVDGVSLTINAVEDFPEHSILSFMIIPETLARTTLGRIGRPWNFNFEVDMMAKFAARAGQG